MKGKNEYISAMKIITQLHKNYKKLKLPEVLKQHSKYISLIRKSAYKSNIEAQFELGLNYEDQNYFMSNPMYNIKKRFYWYSKAASSNHPEACNNLASLYEKGEGTKANIEKALFFYEKSFKLGCNYAKKNYRLLKISISTRQHQSMIKIHKAK